MRAHLLLVLLAASSGAWLLPSPTYAQDRDQARQVFEEGSRQFEVGNFVLALQSFERAHTLMAGDPRAQTLIIYNIGRAQQELSRYEDALASFERYLADAPSDAPFREQTLDRVRELRARAAEQPARGPARERGTRASAGSGDWPLFTGIAALGLGAALGGLGAGFFAERERNAGVWNDDAVCLPANGTRASACGAYEAAARDNEAVGIGLTIGAGVALAAGAVLLAIGAVSGEPEGRAELSCGGGPGLVGIACGGTF